MRKRKKTKLITLGASPLRFLQILLFCDLAAISRLGLDQLSWESVF